MLQPSVNNTRSGENNPFYPIATYFIYWRRIVGAMQQK